MSLKISIRQKVTELEESKSLILDYIQHIRNGKNYYLKPLSVELRKLLYPGRGNELITRISKELELNISFPVRAQTPVIPPTYINVSITEYLDGFIFFQDGEEYTRKKLIDLISNKKGAHLDDDEEEIHQKEKNILIPFGNPRKEGRLYTLATSYLMGIAKTVVEVLDKNLDMSRTKIS